MGAWRSVWCTESVEQQGEGAFEPRRVVYCATVRGCALRITGWTPTVERSTEVGLMIGDIAELKAAVDLAALVEMDLGPPRKRSGRWWWWLRPFHADTRASFGVTLDNGRFKCFGCGGSGDRVDYLERGV